jgi:oligopeptide/dipeptide ABC transporter ATP-binding protein
MDSAPILSVENLRTHFITSKGRFRAVDGVSFSIGHGETLGIVGESGCGKSVSALSILRLLPEPPARIVSGSVYFGGSDLLRLSESELQEIRGNRISIIFQEPMTSLNPTMTIGRQVGEVLERHQKLSARAATGRAVELLDMVQISEPGRRLKEYPHSLSGGMRQRVMIAMALACKPSVLIADEPTTALDVTIQAQILDLMQALQDRLGTSIIMITHDLGIIAEIANRVLVMYAGTKVEEADVDSLFENPQHPYTMGLLAAIPRLDRAAEGDVDTQKLAEIPGVVPSLKGKARGCPFAPRCRHATDRCRTAVPPLEEKQPGHWAACWESERLSNG